MNEVLLRLIIPIAPSANVYYRQGPNRSKNPESVRRMPVVTHVSKEGRLFNKAVEAICIQSQVVPLHGRLAVRAAVWFVTDRGDIDNRIKPTLDALENAGVFANDLQVECVEFHRAGVAPLETIPIEERTSARKTRRVGRMAIEIERFDHPREEFDEFMSQSEWDF